MIDRLDERKSAVQRVEAAYGKPAPDVLVDAINETGSVAAASRKLHIADSTAYHWVYKWRIHLRTVAMRVIG